MALKREGEEKVTKITAFRTSDPDDHFSYPWYKTHDFVDEWAVGVSTISRHGRFDAPKENGNSVQPNYRLPKLARPLSIRRHVVEILSG